MTNENTTMVVSEPVNYVVSLQQYEQLAKVFVASGLFKDVRSVPQAIVKILAGKELGLSPFCAMRDIHIIREQTALAAAQINARMVQAGVTHEVLEQTDEKCVLLIAINGHTTYLNPLTEKEVPRLVTFTIHDAEKLGLSGKDNWIKQPRVMLYWRAISETARKYCAHVFNGAVYTPEELTAVPEERETHTVVVEAPKDAFFTPEKTTVVETLEATQNPWDYRLVGTEMLALKFRGKKLGEIDIERLKTGIEKYPSKFTENDRKAIAEALEHPELRLQ